MCKCACGRMCVWVRSSVWVGACVVLVCMCAWVGACVSPCVAACVGACVDLCVCVCLGACLWVRVWSMCVYVFVCCRECVRV